MPKFIKIHKVFWGLFSICVACGLVAALLFQFADNDVYEFIIAAFLQVSAVFLALAVAYYLFERNGIQRQNRIDQSVLVAARSLRGWAVMTVIRTANSVFGSPSTDGVGESNDEKTYLEARELVLQRLTVAMESHDGDPLPSGPHYRDFLWIMHGIERFADRCNFTVQLLAPVLTEYNVLFEHVDRIQRGINEESSVWEEFEKREPIRQIAFERWEAAENFKPGSRRRPLAPEALPRPALFNLVWLCKLAVHLVDVLDSPDFAGDKEYEDKRRLAPEARLLSSDWGQWK